MSVLDRLASAQGRRDEEPNKALARELVESQDTEGIREIAENLYNKDRKIQTDCDAVLEEIGRIEPELIEDYVSDFLELLSSKNNRMVWGVMINLSLIAGRKPAEIYEHFAQIVQVIDKGSVITRDSGIKTLAIVGSVNEEYNRQIFPYLIEHLRTCRPKSVPQHAESIFCAVNAENKGQFVDVLNQRLSALSPTQEKRVRKLLNKVGWE